MMSRLVHHAHVLSPNGNSYRRRDREMERSPSVYTSRHLAPSVRNVAAVEMACAPPYGRSSLGDPGHT
jgi:hypothetical protein